MRTQIATLVRVTTIQKSSLRNPERSFAVLTTHHHPIAHRTNHKTYDVDVVFADDDDGDEDVCWRFQIMEGEDMLDRLLNYSQAFGNVGKRSSGDDYYDQYVMAFQERITYLVFKVWASTKPNLRLSELEEEDEGLD